MKRKKRFIIIGAILIVIIAAISILQLPYFQLSPEQREMEEALREQYIQEPDDNEEAISEEEPAEEVTGEMDPTETSPDTIEDTAHPTVGFSQEEEVNIVALGDSLTQGIGDNTDQGGYVGILDRTLRGLDLNVQFENYGKRGNRSDQLLNRLEDEPEIGEAIQDAEIILITIGANDIMQVLKENITNLEIEVFNTEQVLYEERLTLLLEKLRDLNADASIYLLGVFNPFKNYFEEIPELDLIVDNWNSTGSSVIEQDNNATFIPIADLFDNAPVHLFAEDNFHPNYEGYYRMAERVLEYINQ